MPQADMGDVTHHQLPPLAANASPHQMTQQMGQSSMEYPPFSQMRVISVPNETPKKVRKTQYQKFTDEEDLWIVKKAVENRDQFKNGSKREFWRKVQAELSTLTGKEYTLFDRHITNIMKKRRDRVLKMPQQYLDWLDKWIEWHDAYTGSGNDIPLLLPDDSDYPEPSFAPNGGSKKRKRATNESGGGTPARRGPGRPPNSARSVAREFVIVEDDTMTNGTPGSARMAQTPVFARPPATAQLAAAAGAPRPSPGQPAFGAQPFANVQGLVGAAANDLDATWLQSSAPDENNIDGELNRIVEKLRSSLDKTSPRTAANSSLLLAIIGLVRDNRSKIVDMEELISKEQKKRKWNDDVLWSMVRNKCADLDSDFNARQRPGDNGQAANAEGANAETFAVTRELKLATADIQNQVSRLLTDGRQAADDIGQLRELSRQHRQYIDGLKTIVKRQSNGARPSINGKGDMDVDAEISALQEQLATLRQERDQDKETIINQNNMLWRMEERLRNLEENAGLDPN